MADSDTFSSDDEPITYQTAQVPKTSFVAPDNTLVDADTEYDPKTGENLTIQKVAKLAPELKPVVLMKAPDTDIPISVPMDKLQFAMDKGLKPFNQLQAENSAQIAKANLKAGLPISNYQPSPMDTVTNAIGQAMSSNLEPQVSGVFGGLNALRKGENFGTGYQENKEASEAAGEALANKNPKSNLVGNIFGNVAQIAAGNEAAPIEALKSLGSVGRNVLGGAAIGGVSNAAQAANQDQDMNSILNKGAEGASIGSLGTLGGIAAAKTLGAVGSKLLPYAANKIVTPSAQDSFSAALEGKDVTNPSTQALINKKAVDYTSDLEDTIDEIRKQIGKQINDHLQSVGPVDHTPLIDSFNDSISNLDEMAQKTANKEKLNAINQAKDQISQAIDTLKLNPESAPAVNLVKQELAPNIYDSQGNRITKSTAGQNITPIIQEIENSRKSAQSYLENLLPDKIKGTNQAYKDILEAQNPQDAYDQVIPNLSDLEAMRQGSNSLKSIRRINNLNDFNQDIQNNTQLAPDLKQKLNDKISELIPIMNDSSLVAKAQNATGFNPFTSGNQTAVGAHLGNFFSPQSNNFSRGLQNTVEGSKLAAQDLFNNLPPALQERLKDTPELAKILLKAIPSSTGPIINTGVNQ